MNLVGRVFMPPADCPFRTADMLLSKEPNLGKVILVDLHAEATSEKIAMGRYLDGRVSAVVGTHTHVQTSDETILPKKTAYLTDLGMTGSKDSVLGRDLASVLSKFVTGMPSKFEIAEDSVALEGALIDVDETTGRARKIVRLREIMDHVK
jgi:metallophosphoesterase (TIGR00282 family)